MSKSIRLHPKHGVNPTIPICFWCGESKNEIALLGAAYKRQAPMNMLLDREPCDKCLAKFNTGIVIMEHNGNAPTGCYVVVTEDCIKRIITPGELVDDVLKKRKAYMEPQAFNMFRQEGDGK